MIATPVSKKKSIVIKNKGNIWKIKYKFAIDIIDKTNPAIIFNIVWPATIFTKSLIAKLIGLKKKDISSIGTSKNANGIDTPEGKNNEKIFILCFKTASIFIAININKLNENVTINWQVTVKV